MKNNYDFSKAQRGKFYRPDTQLNIPVYLDKDVKAFVEELATSKKKDISTIVNHLLKTDMKLAQAMEK